MRLIRQRDKLDCGVASLAMALGIPYEALTQRFPALVEMTSKRGLSHYDLMEVLYRYDRVRFTMGMD